MDHQAFAQLLGNYGEFVGAIAVVATLIYLAIQVRHSARQTSEHTQAVRVSTRTAVQDAFARWRSLVSDELLGDVYLSGYEDYSSLDIKERFRFGLAAQELFYAYETMFVRSESEREASHYQMDVVVDQIGIAIRPTGLREWWERNRRLFYAPFAEEVDKAISQQ